jgi:hypothetical protein
MWSIKHVPTQTRTTIHTQPGAYPRTKGGPAMATTKVIATTWAKKDLVAKLKATLKRMDAEIVEWDKNYSTLEKRQEAWDKKAEAWAKKNMSKAIDFDFNAGGYKGPYVSVFFNEATFEAAMGKRPNQGRKPQYKDTSYNKDVSEYEQVENAIALIEGATDTEFKINSSSTWASFIR